MGGVGSTWMRRALAAAICGLAGVAAGCGSSQVSPDHAEAQIEQHFRGQPQFVECDRARNEVQRFTCRVETSSDRYRFVATCPSPRGPCAIRQTGAEFK